MRASASSVGPVQGLDTGMSADGLFSAEGAGLDDHMEAEVHVLSEVWKVFEQVVKQVTALVLLSFPLPSLSPACPPVPPPSPRAAPSLFRAQPSCLNSCEAGQSLAS